MTNSDAQMKELIISTFQREFFNRITIESTKKGAQPKALLNIDQTDEAILLNMAVGEVTHCLSIPLPTMHEGVQVINHNEVRRAICGFYRVDNGANMTYLTIINSILFGGGDSLQGILPEHMIKKFPAIQQISFAMSQDRINLAIHHLQRCINSIVNKMPLYTTAMNAHVMNKRIFLIDPVFEAITDPKEMHKYQVEKAKKYFKGGLTPLGQSDGAMADKNYILATDLRNLSPFAIKHHNPARNLYSTLGMKGDELPLVSSFSADKLKDEGITRTGWNLFTVFLDIKDVFEDQIMVDESHMNKFAKYTKRFQCYGKVEVAVGDKLKYGQTLSVIDDEEVKFKTTCCYAEVKRITESIANVGGIATTVSNVIVEYRRGLKDGVKITNLAANKGIIRIKKLGYAVDPRNGELRKIDVIVSSKAVDKRKNFTQVLEALWNNCNDEKPFVFKDNVAVPKEAMENLLESKGFPKDGTWRCDTYAGTHYCVCGSVFWGVTHDAEDTVWGKSDTERLNGRELRQAGLKFSAIEFRALNTRFGKDNPITEEVLTYAQGGDDIREKLDVIRSKQGQLPADAPVVKLSDIKYVSKEHGSIVPAAAINGTVVDDCMYPKGFVLELPVTYQVVLDEKGTVEHEGFPVVGGIVEQNDKNVVHNVKKLYVPYALLRKCWKHPTGRFGLSDIGTLVNNIVELGHRYLADKEDTMTYKLLYNAISRYYSEVARSLGSKNGDLSVYGMAVRYPHSAKAVATLSNSLPKNTVEIHTWMAEVLGVKTGDVVLVERFPCLGFMSLRPQKVKVTDDPLCRYTIRVSGNSLGSTTLDFDGDVIYLASFFSKAAKKMLKKEHENPNKTCYEAILKLNAKAGKPQVRSMCLQDYEIVTFDALTEESLADIVDKLAGVKNNTGPVIALSYNVMRLIENSDIKSNQKTNVAVELFLDKVANSIFKQKHGVKALHEIVVDAICTGDVESLAAEGFARNTSKTICDIIREKARRIGVNDLVKYHSAAKERGSGNIITRLVREQNKIYFASRSQLEGLALLKCLECEALDVPSKLLIRNLKGDHRFHKTTLDKLADEKSLAVLNNFPVAKQICIDMFAFLDKLLWKCKDKPHNKVINHTLILPKRTGCGSMADIYYNYKGGDLNGRQQEVLGNLTKSRAVSG